ncbi:MAG: hypothetical protein JWP18_1134 [Solirubrobacterales bacterium]|nr:hypothetical protein [Solirubrobacterales bacterium]
MYVILSFLALAQNTDNTAEAPDDGTSALLIIGGVVLFLLICVGITLLFRRSRTLNRPPGRTTPD